MSGVRNSVIWLLALSVIGCAQGAQDGSDASEGLDATVPADAAIPDAEEPDACVSSGTESCNGMDDDCDGEIDEGFGVGDACDSDDADACTDDQTACTEDGLDIVCIDIGPELVEVCNGLDDDCRASSADGEGDPSLGASCDGTDSDLCLEGIYSCTSGVLLCSDNTASTIDLCNGLDDDCDASSADGSEDSGVGALCDGADGDLCKEGTMFCAGGDLACSDLSNTTIDLCNGTDDDCDVSSADGSEDPQNNQSCDGQDDDLCLEGVRSCVTGNLVCSDNTGSTLDLCNGVDDDCDGTSADGSEDSAVGVLCDGADTDLCQEGTTQCVSSNVQCSDTSGNDIEVCNGEDDDCDQSTDEDFPRDTNPLCNTLVNLGSVSGDLNSDVVNASEGDERWYRVTISEDNFSSTSSYLSARVTLDSPASMDFDLFVYCESCGGGLAGQSNNGTGASDTVDVRRNDGSGDESFDIYIEVRYYGATACSNWDLTVTSDTPATVETCAP